MGLSSRYEMGLDQGLAQFGGLLNKNGMTVEGGYLQINQSVEREERRNQRKMSLRWLEAVLPLGIIAGFLCVMGNAQYYIHKAAHGRPKHIGNDMWDVAMERRDKKMMEILASPSSSSS